MGAVDPRVEQYARLLVERSLDVQPGWQVMVIATPLARPLVEELVRQIARRGAWPLVRLSAFEDFVYGACLLDWDAERERMERYAERFDAAETVRIVSAGTDLTLSIAGRNGLVDDAHLNMPGGEFFYSPVEDSAEGVVEF